MYIAMGLAECETRTVKVSIGRIGNSTDGWWLPLAAAVEGRRRPGFDHVALYRRAAQNACTLGEE